MKSTLLPALGFLVLLSSQTLAGGNKMDAENLDRTVYKVLKTVINHGADLFNKSGDYAGCYRVYESGLITVKPFLAHRPHLQKAIDDGLAEARGKNPVEERAFVLRGVLDRIRAEVKGAAKSETPKTKLPKPKKELPQSKASVSVRVEKNFIDFMAGNELAARYQIGPNFAKPILWPLNAPGGAGVTRSWPMDPMDTGSKDHPHQKSAWFCHGDVIPEGITLQSKIRGVEGVDFWSEAKGHGQIVCTKVGKPKITGNHARLATKNEWRTGDGIKIMDETRKIFFYDFGQARLIVFDINLAASVCPITFGDTKEGALGIRINDVIRAGKGQGTITNSEGQVDEKGCWGKISHWCDYSGPIDGKTVGLAILADPKNPYPCCWHSRNYGLMAANPFGRARSGFPAVKGRTDLVRLDKGQHLHLRFGFLVHEGNARSGNVASLYQEFVRLRSQEHGKGK